MLLGTLDDSGMNQRALLFAQYAFVLLCVPVALLGRTHGSLIGALMGYAWGVALLTLIALGLTVVSPGLAIGSGALSGSGRLAAFVGNSNAYSRQAGMAALVLFWATDRHAFSAGNSVLASRVMRLVNVGGLLVVGIGAVLAQSFGGLLALSGGLLLVALLSRRLGTLVVSGGVFATATALALLVASTRADLPISSRLVRDLSRGDLTSTGNFNERAELKRAAWTQIERSPWRGLGADRFRESTDTGQGAHDTLLLIWAEGGAPALAGFLGVLVLLGVVHIRALAAGDADHSIGLAIGIYALFLLALVVNNHVYARGLMVPVLLAGALSLLHGERALAKGASHA